MTTPADKNEHKFIVPISHDSTTELTTEDGSGFTADEGTALLNWLLGFVRGYYWCRKGDPCLDDCDLVFKIKIIRPDLMAVFWIEPEYFELYAVAIHAAIRAELQLRDRNIAVQHFVWDDEDQFDHQRTTSGEEYFEDEDFEREDSPPPQQQAPTRSKWRLFR